jgi:hypothetical protein
MKKPIQAGDLAEVIGGMQGANSPNLGLIVKVVSAVGEHAVFGRIWRCDAEYAVRGQPGVNVTGMMCDFAQDWLRKIEPPAPPTKSKKRKLDEQIEHG